MVQCRVLCRLDSSSWYLYPYSMGVSIHLVSKYLFQIKFCTHFSFILQIFSKYHIKWHHIFKNHQTLTQTRAWDITKKLIYTMQLYYNFGAPRLNLVYSILVKILCSTLISPVESRSGRKEQFEVTKHNLRTQHYCLIGR